MDDFGTGYSSIGHLRDPPIAGMKLDRSFTSGIGVGCEDSTSDRLAQAVQGLVVGLGLDPVAEGVEARAGRAPRGVRLGPRPGLALRQGRPPHLRALLQCPRTSFGAVTGMLWRGGREEVGFTHVDSGAISLIILGLTVVLFIWNRLPVEIVALGTALALATTGVLTLTQSLAGFGDPVVVFIAALFVVSEGIDATGLTTWAGQKLIDVAGDRPGRLVVLVLLMCAALTALISLTGAVAALLPMVVVLALRLGKPPAHLAMPLAFAGSAGSLLVLTGTPINVIVSEASVDAGGQPFGFFEFGIVGVPLVIGTIAICVLLGPRVLPVRTAMVAPSDLGGQARTLVEHYANENDLYRLRIRDRSPFVGVRREALYIAGYDGLTLVAVQSHGEIDVRPLDSALAEGDVLVVRGAAEQVSRLVVDAHLAVGFAPDPDGAESALIGRELGVAEVVIPPRSRLVGQKVFPGMVRTDDRVVLAVHRFGRDRDPCRRGRAGLSVDLVDDHRARRRTHPALRRDPDERCR